AGFDAAAELEGHEAPARLPLCRIDDRPDLRVRGVHLDISRNRVPTMNTLCAAVDGLSRLKINHLQLYTEHTFAYEAHPEVWREASPMTPAQVRELDEYCRERGIELVANQNSFGHMERWLRHPAYHHLAESPGGFTDPWGVRRPWGSTLSPAVAETRDFLAGLYDELLPNFTSRMVSVGGDEPWELCRGRSRPLCAQRGHGRVYLDFLLDIHRLLAERDARMLFYGDSILAHPELIPELPRDAMVIDWGYESEHPFDDEAALFAAADHDYVVCAGTSSWNSISGRWTNARENISRAARAAVTRGADGLLIADWGDNGHLQQFPVAWPGLVFAAAVAWDVERNVDCDIEAALTATLVSSGEELTGEAAAAAARAVLELGDVYLAEPISLHNATLSAAAALPALRPYYRAGLAEAADRDRGRLVPAIERARSAVAELSGSGRTGAAAGSGSLLREELAFTVDFLSYAADFSRALAEEPRSGVRGGGPIEVGMLPAERRTQLRGRVEDLAGRFAALWPARYRPGGLADSLSVFRAMADELK
ncbi:MAG: beta-N-acetylhexosaminidase, partial [Spirochaetaceae bacterium]